ncbi:dolichol-phosphate mannosyltransferase, putative [Plasmodium berghei]|uniref:Dolichol-phosphate mannosyltransferase subunit 1 n=2 Tax=Plasmodium berghei TaxID=5821 RepID=A0A509ALD8_PLABA|nr:dolichol-phosphate mannosyltransferase, putative [Plasmodium berghei ANKA]CXI40505.1 dolichol-phosphate mannosyltransferase, putative [Plasmodium berghei]SCM21816.1 dolichol-phosphate mannosyltransferase, putative [Plasmodium berghei]SCN25066.1 dolichol-phosphate mannosyltransferase, putative [Plasmodium berghei]SCO60091.1 dolichol-phosphate mannosyltransferase, putative [Plasmodium berghei]SCO61618.1 dolichol-phosphate mannosyltransferase, putative [Plasmodium berghei]|eukprot:XP_034421425.1 dolichol-phosphate mannosyltransferase, putative [Plasmodium berghei ANKA]
MVMYFFLFILTCLKINMSYGSMYSIILPTYNEKNNVPYIIYMIIDELKKKNINYEVILVDDNSKDSTADVYKKLQLIFPSEKLLLIQRKKKSGLGSAYMDALKLVSGNYVIIMDADLSHHPKYIYEFIKKQKETNCDIVSGSRYNKDGGIFGWSFKRVLISRVANFLSQFLLFINLTDLTGSFRLYKTDVLKEIIQNVQGKGFSFQMEAIVRAHKTGKKIEEVGYIFYNRLFGESKLASNDIIQYLFCILRLFWTL